MARPAPLTYKTRWKDSAGREWRIATKLPGGRNECITTDRRRQCEWSTQEIREAGPWESDIGLSDGTLA